MKFGSFRLEEAEGGILAHSFQLGALRLRKGRVLSAQDIAQLRAAGAQDVTVALLGSSDVEENAAAARVAAGLVGLDPSDLIDVTTPFTGRVNIIARTAGLAKIDARIINVLNACDPMITCATVAPLTRLDAGGLIATIKIISYGVEAAALEEVENLAAGLSAIGLIPVALKSARLIVTQTGAEPCADKGIAAINGRLEALGMTLGHVNSVRHETGAITAAIQEATEDLVLILTASATSDPLDVAPEAVRQAGGTVERFGMPVDPGNLLFLGQCGGRPVIGLPGCARSPALNGADWVLERVACGLVVSDADIAGMGVGGLLKEIPQRPHPRRAAAKK
ncbi:molybdopterin-binding protein [Litoreibacter sp.]|nr:molybdopterin-binding protein [Litoreibacter sp.]